MNSGKIGIRDASLEISILLPEPSPANSLRPIQKHQENPKRLKTQEVTTDSDSDWQYIRCKAWRAYTAGAYEKQELRDIEQTLRTMVDQYFDHFTPERATFTTSIEMIVSRAIAKFIEARKAAVGNPPGGSAGSLITMVDDPNGGPTSVITTRMSPAGTIIRLRHRPGLGEGGLPDSTK